MVYDSERERVVLYGGRNTTGDTAETWEYDGVDWVKIDTLTNPGAISLFGMAYDSPRKVTVFFGRYLESGSNLNDTWEYNRSGWSKKSPLTSPDPTNRISLAYDTLPQVTVLFKYSQ